MFYDENVSMAGTLNLNNWKGHVNGIFSSVIIKSDNIILCNELNSIFKQEVFSE